MAWLRTFLVLWICCLLPLLGFGCSADGGGGGGPPVLDPLADQQIAVGEELRVALRGSDPDGQTLSYSYASDLGDIANRAAIEPAAGGGALFRYTPVAADVGVHSFDFSVSDGESSSTHTISIEVLKAAGGVTAPVFRQPLGTGTTLDLTQKSCVEIPIQVEDADSPGVMLGEADPKIEGATLVQDGALTGRWQWCPSSDQIQAADLYTLRLTADDGDNPAVTKDFVIVLRRPLKPGCPGAAPVVTHTPMDESTIVDLTIDALVSDDVGIKYAPLLLYATADPGSPPDLSKMTQLTMVQIDGDEKQGTWAADVPNPVAGQASGSSATLYYVIVARDNDDATGDCDHLTQVPDMSTFSMKVTNPGSTPGLAPCKSCTSDSQCGGANDTCINVGSGTYCGKACGGNGDCPANYQCSPNNLLSVSGKSSKQCVPNSGTCGTTPPPACQDDSYEDNDSLSQVQNKPALAPGSYQLVSCPGSVFDDEDWYPIDISSESTLNASLSGGSATDLDLLLKDSTGKLVAKSDKLGSNESITACLPPGRYYLHVYAWSKAKNTYTLDWSRSAQNCSSTCSDDPDEHDDNQTQARSVNLALQNRPYSSLTNAICAFDEDWYRVFLLSGETLSVVLEFSQSVAEEDLDVLLYRGTTLLTQCTEADPTGCSNNGQSTTSNEVFSWNVTATDTYYVVVRGFDGAENLYDVCITVDDPSHLECPLP